MLLAYTAYRVGWLPPRLSPRNTFGSRTQRTAVVKSLPLLLITAVPGLLKERELSCASIVRYAGWLGSGVTTRVLTTPGGTGVALHGLADALVAPVKTHSSCRWRLGNRPACCAHAHCSLAYSFPSRGRTGSADPGGLVRGRPRSGSRNAYRARRASHPLDPRWGPASEADPMTPNDTAASCPVAPACCFDPGGTPCPACRRRRASSAWTWCSGPCRMK